MIRGEPSTLSGEQNEVFAQPLDRYGYCGKNFTERENKREIKGQMRVVLRPVSLALFTVEKNVEKREEKRRQASPQPMTAKSTL